MQMVWFLFHGFVMFCHWFRVDHEAKKLLSQICVRWRAKTDAPKLSDECPRVLKGVHSARTSQDVGVVRSRCLLWDTQHDVIDTTDDIPHPVNVYITMERSTMLFMGKSTISMAIFNSFVARPGKPIC